MARQGSTRDASFENIKRYWDNEAKEIGNTPQVTIRDHYFRLHELHTLLSVLPVCLRLLDVGCGTGFGTLILSRRAGYTLGIDYSVEMVSWANRLIEDTEYLNKLDSSYCFLWPLQSYSSAGHKVEYSKGDILHLDIAQPSFDVITGQRILINMPSHDDQLRALANLRKHAAKNAWLILTEATIQGHYKTDEYRSRFNLPILEKYWHNNYVDEERLLEWEKTGWRVEHLFGYETYALLSKVIYPAACGPENCKFMSGANASAMEIANIFRSSKSVEEIGLQEMLQMYLYKLEKYDQVEATAINSWLTLNVENLQDWAQIGHQKLIIARAQ